MCALYPSSHYHILKNVVFIHKEEDASQSAAALIDQRSHPIMCHLHADLVMFLSLGFYMLIHLILLVTCYFYILVVSEQIIYASKLLMQCFLQSWGVNQLTQSGLIKPNPNMFFVG